MELKNISGVGDKTIKLLNKLNIYNIEDLVNYYPYRYDIIKRSNITTLNDGDKIIIDGQIVGQPTLLHLNNNHNKIIMRIVNGKNALNITIYNKEYLLKEFKNIKWITVIGRYIKLHNTIIADDIRLEKLPVKPLILGSYYTYGIIYEKSLCKFINSIICGNYNSLDILPPEIINKYNFISKQNAIVEIHNPTDIFLLMKARQRLKYEEIFLVLFKYYYLKYKIDFKGDTKKILIDNQKLGVLINKLDNKLNVNYKKIIDTIKNDILSSKRMNGLIQGDIGKDNYILIFTCIYINYLKGLQSIILCHNEFECRKCYENILSNLKILNLCDNNITINNNFNKIDIDLFKNSIVIASINVLNLDYEYNKVGLIIASNYDILDVNNFLMTHKNNIIDTLFLNYIYINNKYINNIYDNMTIYNVLNDNIDFVETIVKVDKDLNSIFQCVKNELNRKHQVNIVIPSFRDNSLSVNSMIRKLNNYFNNQKKIYYTNDMNNYYDDILLEYISGKVDIVITNDIYNDFINYNNTGMIVLFDSDYYSLSFINMIRKMLNKDDFTTYCVLVSNKYNNHLKILENNYDSDFISDYEIKNRCGSKLNLNNKLFKLFNIRNDYQMFLKVKEDVDKFMPIYFENIQKYFCLYEFINIIKKNY